MRDVCRLVPGLRLPVIGAPMFIVSNPALVAEQCRAGVIGSFPALNARSSQQLHGWLESIESALAAPRARDSRRPPAPFAVNQLVHPSNPRLEADLEACVEHRVPIVITSLNEPSKVVGRVHDYGGLVLHDVTSLRHARKALAAGVDGLVLVCAGAGGHTGFLNPFAFVAEVRELYAGPLVLAGGIATGAGVLGALAAGADLAYVGTRFIASREANAPASYKEALLDAAGADVVLTGMVTGVYGNYLRQSLERAGLDPDALRYRLRSTGLSLSGRDGDVKAWRDIWSAGHGVGAIHDVPPAGDIVRRLAAEYERARARVGAPVEGERVGALA